MSLHLATLQQQLAPLFGAQLPAKAAKAALAKRTAAATAATAAAATATAAPAAGAGPRSSGGVGSQGSRHTEGVAVLLPGVVAKLPAPVAQLAVDLLFHMGGWLGAFGGRGAGGVHCVLCAVL